MAIGYTLGAPQTNLGKALAARKKTAKRTMGASLMLTPMVDMFSLLVVFLLQFFGTTSEINHFEEVALPNSLSSTIIAEAPVMSISKDKVAVEGIEVGAMQQLLKDPEPLVNVLTETRKQWQEVHGETEFKGDISLEADKDLESTTVSQFMAILASQHFGSIHLIAIGE